MVANEEEKRVLHFPQDHMVGWIRVPGAGPDPRNRWELVGDAIGDMAFPIDTPVRLLVEPHSASNLSWLQALQPDDLSELYLVQTYIEETELEHVARLTGLQALALSHPNGIISDRAMGHVQPLKQLRKLYLNATDIGDAGLSYLQGLTQLEVMAIGATSVTDAGLSFLYNLQNLREISFETAYSGIGECFVTDTGISLLKEALPNCIITEDSEQQKAARRERKAANAS